MKAQGKVYNPPDGLQVEGEIIRKNKMGLYVIINDAIRIMVPRDLHIGNEDFDRLEIGDKIRIEIKKSRFQVNDTHIMSIGQYMGLGGDASSPVGASASASEAVAEDAEEDAEETVVEEEEKKEE
jgi:hypothetical protein